MNINKTSLPITILKTCFIIALQLYFISTHASTWLIGPNESYKTPYDVRNMVKDGDSVLIEAATYKNHPQVYFGQNGITFLGINGRPRIEAGSALASNTNGKAIFVIGGDEVTVDNIEFANAKVPDNNGAGIRQEGCGLLIQNCFFNSNEMGILGGNYSPCTVTIQHCEFANNGNANNPGFQHNVYINHIDTLIFQFNYSINAIAEGHELKSRAHFNAIRYNFIANVNSEDSRTIDLPNGGTAVLVGNVIEQGESSVNSNILGYGLEGLSNRSPHNIWVVNNTFINKKSKGSFIQIKKNTDTLSIQNNIFSGKITAGLILGSANTIDSNRNMVNEDISHFKFEDSDNFNYRLNEYSPCIDEGLWLNRKVGEYILTPQFELSNKTESTMRFTDNSLDLGAFEYRPMVGIEENKIASNMLHPNPTHGDNLYIKESIGKSYTIYNSAGLFIQSGLVQPKGINLKPLNDGFYFILINETQFKFYKN